MVVNPRINGWIISDSPNHQPPNSFLPDSPAHRGLAPHQLTAEQLSGTQLKQDPHPLSSRHGLVNDPFQAANPSIRSLQGLGMHTIPPLRHDVPQGLNPPPQVDDHIIRNWRRALVISEEPLDPGRPAQLVDERRLWDKAREHVAWEERFERLPPARAVAATNEELGGERWRPRCPRTACRQLPVAGSWR